jgi:NAD+ synthase (glutamine-hydrolysing)
LANWFNHVLLTTGNRSEASVGYATMDGDTSGGLAPLGGIDKQFIREWLLYAREKLGFKGLDRVCALEPSAELRPPAAGQTDEKDLMPYSLLQKIEALAIGKWYAPIPCYEALRFTSDLPDQVLRGHVIRFYRMWARNQWKRERMAPSFHLDTYSVDPKTWCRFPILNGAWQDDLQRLEYMD